MTGLIEMLKKYSYPLGLGGVFIIAFLLRAYRLNGLPVVLHVDEVGIGYNAWSLANYGVDRYLNEWPIYPKNYNGGQSPLYTYCLVLLLKLFPVAQLSPGLVRIPALFSSMLTVICMAKILDMVFENKKIEIAGTAFMAFCPYFIMSGRYALDCNMMLGTSVLAIALLLRYLKKPTLPALLWCGSGFALILYSYALSYLVVPIFLMSFSLYMLYTKKINVVRLLLLAGEICILALPLISFVICLVFELPGFRFLGINILPTASERVNELAKTDFRTNLTECIKITLTHGIYMLEAVEKFYTMYVISIPFIGVGFVCALMDFLKSLVKRRFVISTIFVLYSIAVLITVGLSGMAGGVIYRANAIFVCYVYFWIVGIRSVFHFLHHYRKAFGMVVCMSYAIWTASFLRYYFTVYPVASIQYPTSFFFLPDKEALAHVMEAQDIGTVYIDSFNEENLYFFYPCSPYKKNNAKLFGDAREFSMIVNSNTPIEEASIYMVRKENREFIDKLQRSGVLHETEEFAYYYVFTIP